MMIIKMKRIKILNKRKVNIETVDANMKQMIEKNMIIKVKNNKHTKMFIMVSIIFKQISLWLAIMIINGIVKVC